MDPISLATDASRSPVVRAHLERRAARGDLPLTFAALDGYSIERIATDSKPGTKIGKMSGGDDARSRTRCELDAKTLELREDKTRSRRVDPASDVRMTDAAATQLHIIAPRLAAVDAKMIGCDPASEEAAEAAITRTIARRYGTGDAIKLWRVGSHSSAFCNTVSRLAAGVDGLGAVFLHSELTVMLPDLVRIEHRKPSARDILAMRFLNAPGALDYEFSKFDRRGRAEHTTDFRGKAPTASISRDPIRRPIRWSRAGMTYGWQEIEQWKQAKKNGAPLPDFVAEYAEAARTALLELENIDLFFGNEDLEILGLLSSANYPQGLPSAIANFVNAGSPEAAVQLLLSGVKRIFDTKMFMADMVGLGTRDYMYVTTTTYLDGNGTSAGKSIADIALERGKPLGLKAIVHIPELGYDTEVRDYLLDLNYSSAKADQYAGGLGQKAVMVTMVRDEQKSRGVCGQDIMQFPPDQTSTETSVQLAMSTAGYEVRHPRSIDIQVVNNPT